MTSRGPVGRGVRWTWSERVGSCGHEVLPTSRRGVVPHHGRSTRPAARETSLSCTAAVIASGDSVTVCGGCWAKRGRAGRAWSGRPRAAGPATLTRRDLPPRRTDTGALTLRRSVLLRFAGCRRCTPAQLVDVDGGVLRVVAHRQPALSVVLGELVVDGVEFEVLAVVDVVRLVCVAGGEEDDLVGGAVVQRTQAHGARMGEHIEGDADQVLGAELGAGLADGRRLVCPARSAACPRSHDDGTEPIFRPARELPGYRAGLEYSSRTSSSALVSGLGVENVAGWSRGSELPCICEVLRSCPRPTAGR